MLPLLFLIFHLSKSYLSPCLKNSLNSLLGHVGKILAVGNLLAIYQVHGLGSVGDDDFNVIDLEHLIRIDLLFLNGGNGGQLAHHLIDIAIACIKSGLNSSDSILLILLSSRAEDAELLPIDNDVFNGSAVLCEFGADLNCVLGGVGGVDSSHSVSHFLHI